MKTQITQDRKDKIVSKYKQRIPIPILSSQHKIGGKTIREIIISSGIKIDKSIRKRKHSVNDNYFDKIDSEAKAYILGFTYGSGTLLDNTVKFSLGERDIDLLKQFKKEMGYSGSFLNVERKHYNENYDNIKRLHIYSTPIARKLAGIGVPKTRRNDFSFPSEGVLPKRLQKHFIRGYFDSKGDFNTFLSCFPGYTSPSKCHFLRLSVSPSFGKKLREIVEELGFYPALRKGKTKVLVTRDFRLTGESVLKFVNWLYSGSKISLNRNFMKFQAQKGADWKYIIENYPEDRRLFL